MMEEHRKMKMKSNERDESRGREEKRLSDAVLNSSGHLKLSLNSLASV